MGKVITRTKIPCELCGCLISKSNYSKHLRRHRNHPETFLKNSYSVDRDDFNCRFCGKECKNKNSLIQHELRCKNNPGKINTTIEGFNNFGRTAWNKGLTKDTDERVLKLSSSLSLSMTGKSYGPLSEEHKKKISAARKKFLSENPEKVPYLINHSSKMSYPEKYFMDIFNNEGIDLKYHLQVSKYELDFYNIEHKLDVEIDGEQHFLDNRIFCSDRERDKFLESQGWKIFRIRWAEYKKYDVEKKKEIIEKILLLLS